MIVPPGLWNQLIDDAAMFPPGNASVREAVAAHREYRQAWIAGLIGPLVVNDHTLAEVGRVVASSPQPVGSSPEPVDGPSPEPVEGPSPEPVEGPSREPVEGPSPEHVEGSSPEPVEGPLAVTVINTGGAGGLVALAGRSVPGIRMVAVESALRDLDDLAGNAGRVAAAAAELDENVRVFVEIPYAPGWERAVEEVEAAGLLGKIRTGGVEPADTPSAEQLARQLSVLVEADLAFKATAGLHHAWPTAGQHGFLAVMVALEALIDGAGPDDAADLLTRHSAEVVAGWTEVQAARVRRRFRSFGCCGVLDPVRELVEAGLIEEGR